MKLGIYQHYKGGEYEVTALAKNETDLSDVVVYKCLYPVTDFGEEFARNPVFTRPYDVFFSDVEMQDGTVVPRFSYIEKN